MTDQQTIQKLTSYEGPNGFVNSVKSGYQKWGSLTPRQMDAIKKFFTPKKKDIFKPIDVNIDVSFEKICCTWNL